VNNKNFAFFFQNMIRVFNVFKAWIENHFEDWADNSELISEFRKFVEQKMAIEMKSAAQQLMKSLRDRVMSFWL